MIGYYYLCNRFGLNMYVIFFIYGYMFNVLIIRVNLNME